MTVTGDVTPAAFPPASDPAAALKAVWDAIAEQEKWVDDSCINLYAATNAVSSGVRAALGSTMASRVAEGRIGGKAFQPAIRHLELVEAVAEDALHRLFNARYADCRVLSGTMANIAALLGLTRPGDTIMAITLQAGAHTSHTPIGFPGYYGLKVVEIPFEPETMNVDLAGFSRLFKSLDPRPTLVILGGSLFLFPGPIAEVCAIAHADGARVMFDGAHVTGLMFGGAFPNPLDLGCDILTSSTYKSFGGPPGGFWATNDKEVFRRVSRATYPGLTTNYHYNRIAALAVAALELLVRGPDYARAVVAASRALGAALDGLGVPVLAKKAGYSASHQVVIDVSAMGGGKAAEKRLEDANILTSHQLLPWDDPAMVKNPSGLRLGTQEVTRLGMGRAEMEDIARLMAAVLLERRTTAAVAEDVVRLRRRFPSPSKGCAGEMGCAGATACGTKTA